MTIFQILQKCKISSKYFLQFHFTCNPYFLNWVKTIITIFDKNMSNFFYTTVQKAFYFLLEFFSRWKYRIFEVFNHSDMSMLCVLQSRIIHKPSNKLFSPKVRAFLRNINIDRTTFYLLKQCFSWVLLRLGARVMFKCQSVLLSQMIGLGGTAT